MLEWKGLCTTPHTYDRHGSQDGRPRQSSGEEENQERSLMNKLLKSLTQLVLSGSCLLIFFKKNHLFTKV